MGECVSSIVFRSYAVLSFQSPKSIQKEEHNSQRIKVQGGSAQACREYSKSRIPLCARGNTGGLPTQLDIFDRELPIRRENIFSRRGAACGQRVTTYKISSRRNCLKTENELRSMFDSASVAGRSSHGNSVLYRPQPVIRTGKRSYPLCGGNRATEAEGPPELRKPRNAGRAA